MLDRHFTPLLSDMICEAVGLDVADLNVAASPATAIVRRSTRRSGFAEEVLRAYAYSCAMCGFDGALSRTPDRWTICSGLASMTWSSCYEAWKITSACHSRNSRRGWSTRRAGRSMTWLALA
jgi:hypothetical protein